MSNDTNEGVIEEFTAILAVLTCYSRYEIDRAALDGRSDQLRPSQLILKKGLKSQNHGIRRWDEDFGALYLHSIMIGRLELEF